MTAALSIAISFLPIALCSLLLLRKKICGVAALLRAVAAGLLAFLPITFLQFFVYTSINPLITYFVLNGLVEEGVKMLFLWVLPRKNIRLRVFFSLSLLAGLSLGCFETVVYLVNGQQNYLLRSFTAVLLHGLCAGLSGFFVYTFRGRNKTILPLASDKTSKEVGFTRQPVRVFSFASAVFLHGLYNFFAGFYGWFWWFSLLCLAFAANECLQYLKSTDPAKDPRF